MTDEDRRIVQFIRERERESWWCADFVDEEIYQAYRKTLFYALVRLHLAVEDFKTAVKDVFR